MNIYRPTWAEISKSAFSSNVRQLKKVVGENVRLMAVLKADAYGHGATALAPLALRNGASSIGVSSLEEAISLRESGITAPILILGGIYPFRNFSHALRYKITPTVASLESAQALSKLGKKRKGSIPFHLKVDTGMGRIGASVAATKKILTWLTREKNISLSGLYSHLASADSSNKFTRLQLKRFQDLKTFALSLGFKKVLFHVANSAGALRHPESHHDMIRPGIALYGAPPSPTPALFPVLSWQTRVIFFKKVQKGTPISYGGTFVAKKTTEVATLPVGYADGVPRASSNQGFVLVKGKKRPIMGRVTMDHIMVDVTGLSVQVGEKATLIGRQGTERITAEDWAKWAGIISYEIFCGISKRVPRMMVK